ncbi:unnamed protein product [Parascedosporium putredinis]|uniref:Protein BIG1 n=1 Tax=Parascedosporium putredinis TaxID=1442378 RepID=A0A9P1GUD4_9PEZI|nr:unnamed protein product [Parascedosporium putredinis]CAI7987513.1 unnamed protein product [Parascedosporium putredinis]
MRLSYAAGALALFSSAHAFSDTSPFILISSARAAESPSQNSIQTSSQVEKSARDFLESCPTDRYLVVLQPGLSSDDLRRDNGKAVPNLHRALSYEGVATSLRSFRLNQGSSSRRVIHDRLPLNPGQAAEASEAEHQELKRGSYVQVVRRDDNETGRDTRGLFQKYEFFNKGLFMTVFASLIFISIVTCGIRALASVDVSYGAFSKEMGPAAQKKQQKL